MLTIYIPDELERELSVITNEHHTFVITAIREKIALHKNARSSGELTRKYSNTLEELKSQTSHFKNTDIESWGDY
jgi:hypothetical protein